MQEKCVTCGATVEWQFAKGNPRARLIDPTPGGIGNAVTHSCARPDLKADPGCKHCGEPTGGFPTCKPCFKALEE